MQKQTILIRTEVLAKHNKCKHREQQKIKRNQTNNTEKKNNPKMIVALFLYAFVILRNWAKEIKINVARRKMKFELNFIFSLK